MKQIKVWRMDGYKTTSIEDKYDSWKIYGHTPEGMEVIFTPNDPDYLLVQPQMYVDKERMDMFLAHKKRGAITIYYPFEAASPDFNLFDYAVSFDHQLIYGDRNTKYPIFVYNENYIYGDFFAPIPSAENLLKQKTGFCNFIYSNGNAHPNRDKLFHKICEYKMVDSLGKHLHNKDNAILSAPYGENWVKTSIDVKASYKFTIASENARLDGYVTEKLLTSFQAYSIPIYWGSPSVHEYFNPKAFINCHQYANFDEVLKQVKKVDQNDELWLEMISQPRCLPWQIEKHREEEEALRKFFTHIFEQDIAAAKRAPEGTHISLYLDWLENSWKYKDFRGLLKNKIIRKLRNIAVALKLKKPL